MERFIRNIKEKQKRRNKGKIFLLLLLVSSLSLIFGNGYVHAENTRLDKHIYNKLEIYPTATNYSSPKVITIEHSGRNQKVLTYSSTVEELLKEKGITLKDNDYTIPELDHKLMNYELVTTYNVEIETFTKSEIVKYQKIEIETYDLVQGFKEVEQEGVLGAKDVTYKRVIENGMEKKIIPVLEKMTQKPIDEVVYVGIRPKTLQDCGYWDKVINRLIDKEKEETKNTWMKFVMRKETWCNSGQVTKSRTTGLPVYFGLYQFHKKTYEAYGGIDIFDGEEQIKVVSKMYDLGEGNRQHHWPVSNTAFHNELPNL